MDMDRTVGSLLPQLIDGKIVAVPYQQFGSNKVVMRAEFRLSVTKFMPDGFARGDAGGSRAELAIWSKCI